MRAPKLICILASLLILLSSCGSAYIVTDRDNDIYINGVKKGSEKVEITRSGTPTGVDVEIKQDNEVVNSMRLKRKLTLNTVVYTFAFSVFGFFGAWQYPKSTYIKGEKKKKDGESIWAKPPKEKSIWE